MPRFLISRLSSLGDVVCTLPVASSLKASFPDAHVTWVVDPRFSAIVECCTAVDELIEARPSFKPSSWLKYSTPFDAVLEMQGLLKSTLATARAKTRNRVGYHWQREGSSLFSARVLPDPTSDHIVDQYVDVARALGGVETTTFCLAPKPEDTVKARALLGPARVLINPGAGWPSKRWPPHHFAELINLLAQEGISCALIGGSGEAVIHAEIARQSEGRAISLAGQTSVRELVALVAVASAHVGGDTGSTHLAAALDVPAIGLYSITKPRRSCPYGQIHRCHYDPAGLEAIQPQAVFRSVMEALTEP